MTSSVPASARRYPAEFLELDSALRQTLDDFEKQRKQQHSATMVVFRKAKKEKQKRLHSELHQLERQVKQLVESVRAAAARSSQGPHVSQTPAEALRGLVAEQEILHIKNVALREEIGRHQKLHLLLKSEQLCEKLPQDASSQWCVEFDRNVSSFPFSYFTRDDFDAGIYQFDLELALSASSLSFVGEFWGGACIVRL
ncbi:hypothetical protein V7S43_004645 [Phytophthora oleae]|uniref:Uncharacterized protein n=1 Tax=Phytophthora oleae TaxID=2107226 RepID=A0ABD3FVT5_9STRA